MQRHRRSLLFLAFMLAMGGIASAFFMPVALFPNVAFPRIQMTIDAGDRPADQMAIQVTTPVEVAVRRVRGVRDVKSTTSRGSAQIEVSFDWGFDMNAALQEINGAAGQVLAQLPAGTQLTTRRMDPTTFPELAYSLRSHTLLAEQPCTTWPSTSCGRCSAPSPVSRQSMCRVERGGPIPWPTSTPRKLRRLDLSLSRGRGSGEQRGHVQAMGRRARSYKLYLLLAQQSAERPLTAWATSWCGPRPGGVVRLEDVRTVSPSTMCRNGSASPPTASDAVLLRSLPAARRQQRADRPRRDRAAGETRPKLPPGVRIANWYDQSQLVDRRRRQRARRDPDRRLLAGLVLFVFLRNTRVIADRADRRCRRCWRSRCCCCTCSA